MQDLSSTQTPESGSAFQPTPQICVQWTFETLAAEGELPGYRPCLNAGT